MKKRYCIKCGAPITNSIASFCEKCGEQFYDEDTHDLSSSKDYSSLDSSRTYSSLDSSRDFSSQDNYRVNSSLDGSRDFSSQDSSRVNSSFDNSSGFSSQDSFGTYSSPYNSRVQNYPGKVRYHKNKFLAFFLSIFPGLGQIYNGQILKGFLIPVILFICFSLIYFSDNEVIILVSALIFLGTYFYAFVDAYKTANDINKHNGNYFYSKDESHPGFHQNNLNSFQKLDAQLSSYFHYEEINGEKRVSLFKSVFLIFFLYFILFYLISLFPE